MEPETNTATLRTPHSVSLLVLALNSAIIMLILLFIVSVRAHNHVEGGKGHGKGHGQSGRNSGKARKLASEANDEEVIYLDLKIIFRISISNYKIFR